MDFFKGSDLRFNLKNSYKKIVAVMVQFGSMLKAYFFRVLEKIQAFKNYLKDLFFSFPLRRKLSIIIGGVVFIVIVVLSLIFQQTEKGLLESKLEEICNLTVQYLSSYDIKDNLLMRNHDEIKLSVLYVKQKNITGLDYAWVINRDGQCIAHTNIKLTEGNQNLFTEEESNFLLGLKETTAIENATHYEYYYPIFATSKDADGQRKDVFLGVAGIGFSKEVALAPIHEARKIIYTIAIFVTIASILGIYFLSDRMVKQIQEISAGARQIGRGNLDIKISVKSTDELGQLAHEFNNMAMHLKEKLHMQKFVSPITRKMIKRYLFSDGHPEISQHREVALLFSDVRDFSGFSQRHDPETVVKVVNIYLDLQARIVEQNFGAVDKFMGDQVMAVFEGVNRHVHLFNAAVSIQKSIRTLNQQRQKLSQDILTVGIGINIGPAVIGNIGSKDRMDYTVVGDVVNLASRFCDMAKSGQIITSTQLYNQIQSHFPAENLGSIKIKGRAEAVEICAIEY
ncbi:MAG TPA: adenylate/guanylate cyclase domain-containing protein [bacterium]|nr:adenylate/guanylate cyclase domain-containing protein [bacterium]